jgi:hypothetical protein
VLIAKGNSFDALSLRNRCLANAWKAESQVTIDEVKEEVKRRHVEAMAEYQEFLDERPSDANLVE